MQTKPHILRTLAPLLVVFAAVACLWQQPLSAADESSLGTAVKNAENAAADTAKNVWQRIDAARLKNRTRDEIVGWVIMGVLVGAVAGMVTKLKSTGLGAVGKLTLGLVGAFLGGILAQVFNVNVGWGPVLIRYEELFFSLLGAIFIVFLAKIIGSRSKKKKPAE